MPASDPNDIGSRDGKETPLMMGSSLGSSSASERTPGALQAGNPLAVFSDSSTPPALRPVDPNETVDAFVNGFMATTEINTATKGSFSTLSGQGLPQELADTAGEAKKSFCDDWPSAAPRDNATYPVLVTMLAMGLKSVEVDAASGTTVDEFKRLLHDQQASFPPAARQRLVYGGRELGDGGVLLEDLLPPLALGKENRSRNKFAIIPEPHAAEPDCEYYVELAHYHGYVERILVNRESTVAAVLAEAKDRDIGERWAHGVVMLGDVEVDLNATIAQLGPYGSVEVLEYQPLPNYNVEVVYNPEDCDQYNNDESPPVSPRGVSFNVWFEVRLYSGEEYLAVSVSIAPAEAVITLKKKVQEEFDTTHYKDVPLSAMKLLYQGNVCRDGELISAMHPPGTERGTRLAPAIMQLYVIEQAPAGGQPPSAAARAPPGAGDDSDDDEEEYSPGGARPPARTSSVFGLFDRAQQRRDPAAFRRQRILRCGALFLLTTLATVGIVVGATAALADPYVEGECLADHQSESSCRTDGAAYRPVLSEVTFEPAASAEEKRRRRPQAPASCTSCEYYFPSNNHRTHRGAHDFCEGEFPETGVASAARVPRLSTFVPQRLCDALKTGAHKHYWIDAYKEPFAAQWHTARQEALDIPADMLDPLAGAPLPDNVTRHLVISPETCRLRVVIESNQLDVGAGCEFETRDRKLRDAYKCSAESGEVHHATVQGTLALGQTCSDYCQYFCADAQLAHPAKQCCQARLFFDMCSCTMADGGLLSPEEQGAPTPAPGTARHETFSAKLLPPPDASPDVFTATDGRMYYRKEGAVFDVPSGWVRAAGKDVPLDHCALLCGAADRCVAFEVGGGEAACRHYGRGQYGLPRTAASPGHDVYALISYPASRCSVQYDAGEPAFPYFDSCRLAAWTAAARPFTCFRIASGRGPCHRAAPAPHVGVATALILMVVGGVLCCAAAAWLAAQTLRGWQRQRPGVNAAP